MKLSSFSYHEIANQEGIDWHYGGIPIVHHKRPSSAGQRTNSATSHPTEEAEWTGEIRVDQRFQPSSPEHLPRIDRRLDETFIIDSDMNEAPSIPVRYQLGSNSWIAIHAREHELICLPWKQNCTAKLFIIWQSLEED